MTKDILNFEKYKNVHISQIPSSYLHWLRKSSKETIDDLEDELWRRGEYEPETPIPAPANLSERAQAMLRYVIDNLAGKSRSSIFNMFSGGMFGTYAEAQAAWTEILRSRIPIGDVFSEEPPEETSGDLIVLSKAQVEELIAHAMQVKAGLK
jgi:hypothetical protein